MMDFPTQYDKHERRFMETGDRFEPTYALRVDEDGVKDLAVTGQTDRYAYIQSWRDSVDINMILQRFTRGDVNALNQKQPLFGDFYDMPRSLCELQNLFLSAENDFNALPVEEKQKYNFSFDQYIASVIAPNVNISPVAPTDAPKEVPADDAKSE